MYNLPDNGAIFPNEKKTVKDFNFAIFDWQNYNSIDFDFETSENLPLLENYLKSGYKNRPMMPQNLRDELILFVNKSDYRKDITIVAHSIGNQVIIRAYNMLPENIKERIKYIVLLDPFTTNYYDYIFKKAHANYKWLSGSTNPDIKNDLTKLLAEGDINGKLYVIVTTDIGKSWYENFSLPFNIITIEDNYQDIPLNSKFPYKIKKYHNGTVNDYFYEGKYDGIFQ
jgi:pimeloyl-ACP methyl ester carboxylesterase